MPSTDIRHEPAPPEGYDPDLLYVECSRCHSPIVWERGKTGDVLSDAGIEPWSLDPRCLILSEGCPRCKPHERMFDTSVVRLSDQAMDRALGGGKLADYSGTA